MVAPLSLVAVGAGFVTVHVNVCDVVALAGSVAVIVTLYGPPTEAFAAIVPVISPVEELILNPLGSPLTVNVSTLLVSGSEKLLATFNETV